MRLSLDLHVDGDGNLWVGNPRLMKFSRLPG